MSDRLRAVLGERYGEVIEQAARAMHGGSVVWPWELDHAREALAAVLPDLLAEAWDEGYQSVEPPTANPYREETKP